MPAPGLLKNDASPPERDEYARETDAGSGNSSAIGATEDTLSRRSVRSGGRGFVVRQARSLLKNDASPPERDECARETDAGSGNSSLLKAPPAGWAPAVFEGLDAWTRAKEILFVRLDTIGDVLMTTPAMRAFKERDARPSRGRGDLRTSITLLTSPVGAAAARFIPEIDEVIVYEAPWMKATPPRADSSFDTDMITELKRRRFDAALIPTVYSQNPLPSALLCYLAEIPLRAAHCHENPYQLLTHWLKDPEPETLVRHEVQRQLDLAAALGATTERRELSFRVPREAREEALALLSEAGVDLAGPWVLAHPGSTAPSRRYPAALFAEALGQIVSQTGVPVVLTGDESDRELTEQIARKVADAGPAPAARVTSLAGRTTLDVLAAVIEAASVLLANNTGPVHIAAAVGTPVVDLYALTNPQHTPWGVPNRVLYAEVPCRICYKSVCPQGHQRCLADVPPGAVVEAVRELLAERGKAGRW